MLKKRATVFKHEISWKSLHQCKYVVKKENLGSPTKKQTKIEEMSRFTTITTRKSKSDLLQHVPFWILKGNRHHYLFASQIYSHILFGLVTNESLAFSNPSKQFDPGQWFSLSKYLLLFQSHTSTCLCNIQTFESKQKCFSIFLSVRITTQ